jgi:cell division protein FtsB
VEQYHAEHQRRQAAGALAALQAENQALQTQIDGMLTELNALRADHDELRRAADLARADYAALQADYAALSSQHQALVRQVDALRDLPPPVLELAARRVYRGLVPTPIRLKLRSLRTRR